MDVTIAWRGPRGQTTVFGSAGSSPSPSSASPTPETPTSTNATVDVWA